MKYIITSEYTAKNDRGYEQVYIEYEDRYIFGLIVVLRGDTFVRNPDNGEWYSQKTGKWSRHQKEINECVDLLKVDFSKHQFPDYLGKNP